MTVEDILPPKPRHEYGPVKPPGISHEGGGYLVTCTCRWVRWWPRKTDATSGGLEHQKKCPKREAK